VLARGINEYPGEGHEVDPETYQEEYEALLAESGIRFVPDGIDKDVVFAALVLFGIGWVIYSFRAPYRLARSAAVAMARAGSQTRLLRTSSIIP
jgi:hypothetical protein